MWPCLFLEHVGDAVAVQCRIEHENGIVENQRTLHLDCGITGASSGIGEAAVRHLAAQGARVVLGARRTERLRALADEIGRAGGCAGVCRLDVGKREKVQALAGLALAETGQLDVLVNNAGQMPLSPFSALKVEEWDRMIDVNIRGVPDGIAVVLPRMEAQGHRHIIDVSSVGGFVVQPNGAVHFPTRFAVRAISEGLRKETHRIRCTCICPGVLTSELADGISDPVARERMQSYRKIAIHPDAIARSIRHAIEQPADVDVNGVVVRPLATQV